MAKRTTYPSEKAGQVLEIPIPAKPKKKKAAVFSLAAIPASVRKSPLKLSKWLDLHLRDYVGPEIFDFYPVDGQRGTIVTITGSGFAPNRTDNYVTIGGAAVPVLAASDSELKVLTTTAVDSGQIVVQVGSKSSKALQDFTIAGYPGEGDDGPPVFALGAGDGEAPTVNPIGTIKVLVVICQAVDLIPPSLTEVQNQLIDKWTNVQTYYRQASYNRTKVEFDIVGTAAALDGNFTDFVDLTTKKNIIYAQLPRVAAIAAQHAKDEGFNLDDYQMLCTVVFTDGDFIRAWGGGNTQTFSYDDGKPATDPAHISINITTSKPINQLWINEAAHWGRFAHEFGHNIVSAPTTKDDGSATLGEDVYATDLVDPNAETAEKFELMGNHDVNPLFTGYHLEKLGYYKPKNIKTIKWDRNPHFEGVEIIAHGLSEDDAGNDRFHLVKLIVSDALIYYIQVRQHPGMTEQIFDQHIPFGAAPNQGGVIVTRVITDQLNNNQQTRFITLMHENRVQIQNDFVEDPARTIRIVVAHDHVQARPLVCNVAIEWAQTIDDDPNGSFDLKVNGSAVGFESPDIWIDRPPVGTFDNPKDSEGRPKGAGDKPWVNHVNQFTARVHVSGAMGASNVKLTFYAVTPPGVGDNGNWAPIAVRTIANIPKDSFVDSFCNWVPVVDKHSCLRVYASHQLGEISGGNNAAQENVLEFQAAGSSPADPVFIKTAVRNPLDEPRAIQLTMHGLPLGWAAQIPHAWVWLEGKAEREIDVMVWPLADINVYKFPDNEKGEYIANAPLRVVGHVERNYNQLMPDTQQPPGSRFYPIGGTFYRVGVRRRAEIFIEAAKRSAKTRARILGGVLPARRNQRVVVDVLLPDGNTHRVSETKTDGDGIYVADVVLLDDDNTLQRGKYAVQAFILNATELADAESSILTFER